MGHFEGDFKRLFTITSKTIKYLVINLSKEVKDLYSENYKTIRKGIQKIYDPGVVAHACNPSTREVETGGSGFAASLSYLVRPSATL